MSTQQPAQHADRDGSERRRSMEREHERGLAADVAEPGHYPDAIGSLVNAAKAEGKAQRTIADLRAEVADLRAAAVEMAPKDEVLVEGSYFARADLPRILGNYMRSANEAWQDYKALAEQVADTRRRAEKAEAALARVGALCDEEDARVAAGNAERERRGIISEKSGLPFRLAGILPTREVRAAMADPEAAG